MYSSTGDKGIQELDQLISNTEFENAVQDKTIATEKEKIEIFEKKLKEKTQDIERMEKEILNNNKLESNSNVKIHLCRESLTSLKKTYCVLDDHIEALNKQLQHTKATRQDQQLQQVGVIDKYNPIWNDYERKYQCNEKVRQLMAFQDELKIIEKENDSLKDNIEQMMSDIHQYHLANKSW
jgi:chromosome segregation ATPase